MPRRPRIQLDRVPLHIVQRGHNREACFFGEEDYQSYLHWLGEALGETECQLQAYTLMASATNAQTRRRRTPAHHLAWPSLCGIH